MENATKAMLIAAGVLIGVMILSLGMVLYSELEAYVEASHERMRFNEINAFNTQFTKYMDYTTLTIQDVVTAANLAFENNINYNIREASDIALARGNKSTSYVAVYLNGVPIESEIQDESSNYYISKLLNDNLGNTYTCTSIEISDSTARVYEVHFQSN